MDFPARKLKKGKNNPPYVHDDTEDFPFYGQRVPAERVRYLLENGGKRIGENRFRPDIPRVKSPHERADSNRDHL